MIRKGYSTWVTQPVSSRMWNWTYTEYPGGVGYIYPKENDAVPHVPSSDLRQHRSAAFIKLDSKYRRLSSAACSNEIPNRITDLREIIVLHGR